jgi:Metal-dependent hydrolases of the beta-lactamase superfamily III
LIQAGYKATVVIHEATLDDSLWDHAIAKFHSTLSEALQVASAMEA